MKLLEIMRGAKAVDLEKHRELVDQRKKKKKRRKKPNMAFHKAYRQKNNLGLAADDKPFK